MKTSSIRRILHPTDFSPPADAALAYALDLAVHTGAELHLLHVVAGRETYASPTALTSDAERDLMIRLREAAAAHLGALEKETLDALNLAYELAEGRHEVPAIVAHAARHGADVIALGTHGRGGLRHLFLGSVAEEVVREAPCPVLVVRGHPAPMPVELNGLVVPVDFSEHAGPAVAQAKHLAALYGASLTLLFVAEEHVMPFFSDTGIPTFSLLKIDPDIVARAEAALRQLDARTDGEAVPTAYTVRTGQPAYEIAAFAQEQQAGLIVMATRGLSGIEHSLLGSVTERVIRTAHCPVWTVNPAAGATPDAGEGA